MGHIGSPGPGQCPRFASSDRLHGMAKSAGPAKADLVENQPLSAAGYQINFSRADPDVAIDNLVAGKPKERLGKILCNRAAARTLGVPVVMLRRPVLPDVPSAGTVEDAIAWLDHALTRAAARGV